MLGVPRRGCACACVCMRACVSQGSAVGSDDAVRQIVVSGEPGAVLIGE